MIIPHRRKAFRSSVNFTVLLVGGGTIPDTNEDDLITDLESDGYTVDYLDDSDADASDADGYGCVFISNTVSSSTLSTIFRDVTVPLVTQEYVLFDNYYLMDNDSSNDSNLTQMEILTTSHPITSVFSTGNLTVMTSPDTYTCRYSLDTNLPAGSTNLAASTDASNRICVAAYEKDSTLSTGTAAEKRVYFGMNTTNYDEMNSDGKNFLRRCVRWATGELT